MAYAMLIAAVTTAIMVTGLCFALGWRKVYIVAPVQFVAALVVTFLVGPLTVRDVYEGEAFWTALIISAVMPVLFVVLRVLVGRLDKSHAGGLIRQNRQPPSRSRP